MVPGPCTGFIITQPCTVACSPTWLRRLSVCFSGGSTLSVWPTTPDGCAVPSTVTTASDRQQGSHHVHPPPLVKGLSGPWTIEEFGGLLPRLAGIGTKRFLVGLCTHQLSARVEAWARHLYQAFPFSFHRCSLCGRMPALLGPRLRQSTLAGPLH